MAVSDHVKHIGKGMPAIGNFIELMGTHEGKRPHFFAVVWVDGVAQHIQNTPVDGVEAILRDHLRRVKTDDFKEGAAR